MSLLNSRIFRTLGALCLLWVNAAPADTVTEPLWSVSAHSERICVADCTAFSPDGGRIATASYDGTVKLWNTATGAEIRTLAGHTDAVRAVAWSPDGRFLVSGSNDPTLKVWDAATGAELYTLAGHISGVLSAAWSPDGRFILSGSYQELKVWDAATGAALRTLAGHTDWVEAAAWSSDGRFLVSGSDDNTLKVWDAATGAALRTLAGHTDWVLAAAWSPDGRFLLSGSTDQTVKLWDATNGTELRTLAGHTNWVYAAAWSPDGRFLLSASADQTVKLWDATDGTELRTYSGHTNWVWSAAYSPDGQFIASGDSGGTLKLWRVSAPPQAVITLSPAQGEAPLSVTLDAVGSADPDGSITGYRWQVNGQTLEGIRHAVTFEQPGNYPVTLTVTDNFGLTGEAQQSVQVADPPPTAGFTVTPAQGGAPLHVTLDASASHDSQGPLTYAWLVNGASLSGRSADYTFSAAGDYAVTLTVTDSAGQSAGAQQTVQVSALPPAQPDPLPPPLPPIPADGPGKAIIIAASGAHTQNTLFEFSEEFTRRMYRLLRQRGYTHEDIVYLNPKTWQDIDGNGSDDGVVDNDLADPAGALQQAFAAAAGLQAGQQFVFYLHGHALPDQLKITRDYWLTAAALRDLLAQVPAQAGQIVILDTCYSGSFLDELAAGQRTVLASADAGSTAWNTRYTSFSDPLLHSLRRGETLLDAFRAAENMMAATPELFAGQQAQLDDDGDGYYTSGDGGRAAQRVIGKEGVRAADAPEITDVHAPSDSSGETVPWLKTSPAGTAQIRLVRAVLIPPGGQSTEYHGEDTDFARDSVELLWSPSQNRYEMPLDTLHSRFRLPGTWRLRYEAQGSDGTWSEPKYGEVRVTAPPPPVTVTARVNAGSYALGERLHFSLDVTVAPEAPGPYDVYAALIFPQGFFVTIAYPVNWSPPGVIQPYRSSVTLSGSETFPVQETDLATGWSRGGYFACGVLTAAGSDPWDQATWLTAQCTGFGVE